MLPANVRKLVYDDNNSLVKSHIEYGIISYGGVEKRTVALKHRVSQTSPAFREAIRDITV
jgi:hypothetical protein